MKVDGEDDEEEHSCQWHRMRQMEMEMELQRKSRRQLRRQ